MRYSLSAGHYAAGWSHQETLTPDNITALGVRYHALTDGPEREAVLLEILKSFHNYITKYADMIRRGHLPAYRSHVNKDSVVLLSYFIPGHDVPTRQNLQQVCRTLHLAFLHQPYDEVYNILAGMVLRAIHNYDPEYTVKVRRIVAAIEREIDITSECVFTAKDLGLPFDAEKPLRWLARKGILEAIKELKVKDPRIIGFRVATWPPKRTLLHSEPIGLTYHIQRQFRFYLQGYITEQMREIETRNLGGLQLEHRGQYSGRMGENGPGITSHNGRNLVASAPNIGRVRGADLSMCEAQLDVGKMNMKWVAGTHDPLFADLSVFARRILYYYYGREMSWKQIARTCRKGVKTIQQTYRQTIDALQSRALQPVAA